MPTPPISLSLSNVISITSLSAPSGLGLPNVNTIALFTAEQPNVAFSLGYKLYKSSTDVLADFASNSETVQHAIAIFAQNPNIMSTNGYLVIVPLTGATAVKASLQIQDLTFTAVTAGTGGNAITIAYTDTGTQGAEAVTVVGSAISVDIEDGVSTAEDIKAKLDDSTAARALSSTAIAVGEEEHAQTAPVTITNLTGGTSAGTEPVQTAITRLISAIYFFGITTTEAISGATLTSLCAYVQTLNKVMALTSATSSDLNPNGVFDTVRQAAQNHVRCLFYSVSALQARVFGSAYLSRALSTDFTGSNTAFTMHLKSISGFASDPIMSDTVLALAQAAGADVYGNIGGIAQVFTSGTNGFFDSVYNLLWFMITEQITGYNFLRQTNYKIAQTEKGMAGLKGSCNTPCTEAVTAGYVAPGVWDSPDFFGDKDDFIRNIKDFGFYIYSSPVALQTSADRQARKSPPIMIALKESGAIHSGSIIIQVNP